jgi:hypothetical protein
MTSHALPVRHLAPARGRPVLRQACSILVKHPLDALLLDSRHLARGSGGEQLSGGSAEQRIDPGAGGQETPIVPTELLKRVDMRERIFMYQEHCGIAGMSWLDIAKSAYRAYVVSLGDGESMPEFDSLPQQAKTAWEAAVRQAKTIEEYGFAVGTEEQRWAGWNSPIIPGKKVR